METKVRSVEFFKDEDGNEPVKEWLKLLKKKNRHLEHSKIITRLDRAAQGNFGDHRILGGNWGELKIDFGPGYRVYFGIDADELIILLNGGTKSDQQTDINLAEERWNKYLKNRKKMNSPKE